MVETGDLVYYLGDGKKNKLKARVVDVHLLSNICRERVYDIVTIEKNRRYVEDVPRGNLRINILERIFGND
jgi:hypothetical protein